MALETFFGITLFQMSLLMLSKDPLYKSLLLTFDTYRHRGRT